MWEPFTESARRAVVLACEEAQRHGSTTTDIDDLLLGIIVADGSCSDVIEKACGVTPADAKQRIEKHHPSKGEASRMAGQVIHFTPRARRIIEFGFEAAREHHQTYIDTPHLLLGILRQNEDPTSTVVSEICGDGKALRKALSEMLTQRGPSQEIASPARTEEKNRVEPHAGMWAPFTEDARRTVVLAQEFASDRGDNCIDNQHLLFGMLKTNSGVGFDALIAAGLRDEQLSQAIDRAVGRPTSKAAGQEFDFTAAAKRTIERAFVAAQTLSQHFISSGHLLLGLLDDNETVARIFAELHLDHGHVKKDTLVRLKAL